MKPFSLTSFFIYIFIAYTLYATYVMYSFMNPSECLSKDEKLCLNPAFKSKDVFQLFLCTSLDSHPLAKKLNCIYHNDSFQLANKLELDLDIKLPSQTVNNGSLFLHAILTKLFNIREPNENVILSKHTVSTVAFLTKYQLPKNKIFNLLNSNTNDSDSKPTINQHSRPLSHWKSRIVLNGLKEPFSLSKSALPYEILHLIQLNNKKHYMPIMYISDVRQRLQDVIRIPKSNIKSSQKSISMPLKIVYEPITIGRLRFFVILEKSFRMIKEFGFGEKEIEDVKGIFFETNHYMLLVTILVISFHALFDFLAFKNDIQFWLRRETMEGLSSNTVFWRFLSQLVITLYLFDRNTSFLVLVPSAIATCIEVWKLKKMLHLEFKNFRFVRNTQWQPTELEQKTAQLDSMTIKILSYYVLPPLLLSGSVYSVLYVEHQSWYSWLIESAVNGVYAFGFIAMLPQLFINYKLKSVAHLPWRAFMYKAFNTFIDDFFAFLITSVPTTHRLATFRDDIVFLIYLYQRWLYPIDKSRSIEAKFGDQSLEAEEKDSDSTQTSGSESKTIETKKDQ